MSSEQRTERFVQVPPSQVSVKTAATVAATALGVVALGYLVSHTGAALGLTAVAAVFAIALDHLVAQLCRRLHLGRRPAIAAVLLTAVAAVVGLFFLVVPPAVEQIEALVGNAPKLIEKARTSRLYERLNTRLDLDASLAQLEASAVRHLEAGLNAALKALTSLLQALTLFATIFFLVIFMLTFGEGMVRRLLDEATPNRRPLYERMARSIYHSVAGYIGGLSVVCLTNAVLTATLLAILRVPYFVILGLLSGLFSILPFVGSALAGALITVVTLATGGLWKAVFVLAYYVVYQQFENHVLGPIVYRRAVSLNPLVTLVAVLFLAELLGLFGAIVAVPMVAVGQIILRELLLLRRERLGLPLQGPASPQEHPPGRQ